MRILVDVNLAPAWVEFLARHEVEAVHWSHIGSPLCDAVDHVAAPEFPVSARSPARVRRCYPSGGPLQRVAPQIATIRTTVDWIRGPLCLGGKDDDHGSERALRRASTTDASTTRPASTSARPRSREAWSRARSSSSRSSPSANVRNTSVPSGSFVGRLRRVLVQTSSRSHPKWQPAHRPRPSLPPTSVERSRCRGQRRQRGARRSTMSFERSTVPRGMPQMPNASAPPIAYGMDSRSNASAICIARSNASASI